MRFAAAWQSRLDEVQQRQGRSCLPLQPAAPARWPGPIGGDHDVRDVTRSSWQNGARRRRLAAAARQLFLISILRSAFTASGFLAAVTLSTPLSNLASTLASSMVSGRRMERSKLPKLRSVRW